MERELGGVERLFLRQQRQDGAGNFCCIFSISGALPIDRLDGAMRELLTVYPDLRLMIEGQRFRYNPRLQSVPWKLVERASEEQWREVGLRELKRDYSESLLFIHVIYSLEKSEIITSFHHSLFDGVAGVQLFEALWALLQGKSVAPRIHGPSLESRMPAAYRSWRGWMKTLFFLMRTLKKVPPVVLRPGSESTVLTVHTDTATCDLDELTTKAWAQAFKGAGANIFSGVTAIVLQGLYGLMDGRGQVMMGTNTPVNLRPRTVPPVSHLELGVFLSGVLAFYEVGEGKDVFTLAREVFQATHSSIARKDDLAIVRLMRASKKAVSNLPRRASRLRPSFNISNHGNLPGFDPIGDARVVHFRGFAALWPHDVIYLWVTTFEGRLCIEVHSSLEKLGPGYAARFAAALRAVLAAGPSEAQGRS